MTATKATSAEIDDFLQHHTHWTSSDTRLQRTYTFRNFREAFGFMTEVALLAECSKHHPEWGNLYNRITVQLTTHDAGGITEKDFDLATQMDSIASRY